MQRVSLAKSEDLNEKQAEAIKLQLQLIEFVTGGENKPIIEIIPLPMMIYPGHKDLPRERRDKYKPVQIYILNKGKVRLRGVRIRASGSLGFEFNYNGLREMDKYPNATAPKLGYVEVGPMTLAKDQRELV